MTTRLFHPTGLLKSNFKMSIIGEPSNILPFFVYVSEQPQELEVTSFFLLFEILNQISIFENVKIMCHKYVCAICSFFYKL